MKKLTLVIAATALAALTLTSCTKNKFTDTYVCTITQTTTPYGIVKSPFTRDTTLYNMTRSGIVQFILKNTRKDTTEMVTVTQTVSCK